MKSKIEKAEVRAQAKELVPKDLDARAQKSSELVSHLLGQEALVRAGQLALFSPREVEADVREIWHKWPNKCVFPKVIEDKNALLFAYVYDLHELRPGYKGILEPPVREPTLEKPWQKGDIILVPGIAFDIYGGRIGSGLGFYDRFLAQLPPGVQKWGVCWEAQLFKDPLIQTENDISMECIATEAGLNKAEKR